jgi:hypothetical protein
MVTVPVTSALGAYWLRAYVTYSASVDSTVIVVGLPPPSSIKARENSEVAVDPTPTSDRFPVAVPAANAY